MRKATHCNEARPTHPLSDHSSNDGCPLGGVDRSRDHRVRKVVRDLRWETRRTSASELRPVGATALRQPCACAPRVVLYFHVPYPPLPCVVLVPICSACMHAHRTAARHHPLLHMFNVHALHAPICRPTPPSSPIPLRHLAQFFVGTTPHTEPNPSHQETTPHMATPRPNPVRSAGPLVDAIAFSCPRIAPTLGCDGCACAIARTQGVLWSNTRTPTARLCVFLRACAHANVHTDRHTHTQAQTPCISLAHFSAAAAAARR
jgi:hypothetical protein